MVLVGLLPSQSVTPPASPLPAPTTTASDHTTTFEKTEAATPDVVSIPTPTPEKMSTPSASAPVAVVEPIEEEKKATKMIKRQSSVVVLPGPPKMTGWLKKRGHVVMNWKTRYFVLNNGFLSYYVDALDRPPYGKNLKGGLCLAGFRDLHSIDRDLYDIAILKKGEAAGGRSASTADTHNTGRSFSIFRRTSMAPGASSPAPAEHEARIHLVFCNNLVEPKALQSLRQGLGGVVEEEESSKGAAKDSHPVELLIEAPSADEKQAWLAALDAHILYIETVSNLNQEEQMKQEEQSALYGKDAVDNEDESYVYTIQSKDDFTVEDSNAVIDNTNSTVSPGK